MLQAKHQDTAHVMCTDVNFIEMADKVIYFAAPLLDYHWPDPDFKAWYEEEMNISGAFLYSGEAWGTISQELGNLTW